MDEKRVIELLAKWDEIIDPTDCDDLIFWLSSWISEKEQDLTEQEGIVAQLRLSYVMQYKSVAKADVCLEVDPVYKEMRSIETELRRLKSARSNVKRRYEILTNRILTNKKY